jgi:hypothetical protein
MEENALLAYVYRDAEPIIIITFTHNEAQERDKQILGIRQNPLSSFLKLCYTNRNRNWIRVNTKFLICAL